MSVSEKQNRTMHRMLPIDDDERIISVYKHHWFAYISLWFIAIFLALLIIGVTVALTSFGGDNSPFEQYKTTILAGSVVLAALVMLFTLIPAWLKSQEHLVLTEEAILQTLQPSLFAAKTSQLNLQHINDVTVRKDFFGTMFGYGHITIETPGEQDNYEFSVLPNPDTAAREIVAAHENYTAAIQGGRMPSTLGTQPVESQTPQVDPEQYQQFLAYQQMVAQQQREAATTSQQTPAPANQPTLTESNDQTQQ